MEYLQVRFLYLSQFQVFKMFPNLMFKAKNQNNQLNTMDLLKMH